MHSSNGPGSAWLRFCAGLAILVAVFVLLASGRLPPGLASGVLERNRGHDVDATAIFYTDLDRMPEIEARLVPGPEIGGRAAPARDPDRSHRR